MNSTRLRSIPMAFHTSTMYAPTFWIFFRSPPILLFISANQSATQNLKWHPARQLVDVEALHHPLRDVHAPGGLEAVVAHGNGLLVQQHAQLLLLDALLAHGTTQRVLLVQGQPAVRKRKRVSRPSEMSERGRRAARAAEADAPGEGRTARKTRRVVRVARATREPCASTPGDRWSPRPRGCAIVVGGSAREDTRARDRETGLGRARRTRCPPGVRPRTRPRAR